MFSASNEQRFFNGSRFPFKLGTILIWVNIWVTSIGKIEIGISNTNTFLSEGSNRDDNKDSDKNTKCECFLMSKDVSACFGRPAWTFGSHFRASSISPVGSLRDRRHSFFIFITVQAGLISRQSIHNMHSKRLRTTAISIMNLYSSKVTVVFRNFPKLYLGALAMTKALVRKVQFDMKNMQNIVNILQCWRNSSSGTSALDANTVVNWPPMWRFYIVALQ